jgi:hypothetical protein
MRIKFGYLVSLLFLAVFAVILLNLGSIRENLESPSCPAGYNYTADGNRCISTTGGPFICPSVATKMRAGNGEIQCIDNNRVQTALNHRGPGGPMTLVDSPPSAASPQQRPAEPKGVPSCGIEKFAAY